MKRSLPKRATAAAAVLALTLALGLAGASLAGAAKKPKGPTLPSKLACTKILTPTKLNTLVSGTTFSWAKLQIPNWHEGPMVCDYWDASPLSGSNNPNSGELVVVYEKEPGAKALKKAWNTYANPRVKGDGPYQPTGIGTRAIEWNQYVVWTRGLYFGEVWSNGSSLGGGSGPALYQQLESVAKYIDAKLPRK